MISGDSKRSSRTETVVNNDFGLCRANGCRCPACFDGLCDWHDEAKNPASWPKITQIMNSAEFKYLAWYWQTLSRLVSPRMIDYKNADGETKWMIPEDMIELFRDRLHKFGIDPKKTERLTDHAGPERLRHYALRMRSLVKNEVMLRTNAGGFKQVAEPIIKELRPIGDWTSFSNIKEEFA